VRSVLGVERRRKLCMESGDEDGMVEVRERILGVVSGIAEMEGGRLGMNVSQGMMLALSELVERYAVEILGPDLRSFARHARRSTVGTEDVLLFVRRSEDLREHLERFVEGLDGGDTVLRRRRIGGRGSSSGGGVKRRLSVGQEGEQEGDEGDLSGDEPDRDRNGGSSSPMDEVLPGSPDDEDFE